MPRVVQLQDLVSQIRERGEIRSVYIGDTALTTMINQSIARLYGFIVEMNQDHYLSLDAISVVAGTDTYALPDDYYKTLGLDYVVSASRSVPLKPFNFRDRFLYEEDYQISPVGPPACTRYRVMGGNVILSPVPTWSGTINHYYVPAPTLLADDTDEFDGQMGWEEWVVLDVVIKCLGKEESDTSLFEREQQLVMQGIAMQASSRDKGENNTVRDVESANRLIGWWG